VEYPVLDWLTVRGGYYRAMATLGNKTEVDGGATSESNVSLGNSGVSLAGYVPAANDENGLMTLGLGLKFGGFAMDATVSEQALRRGLGLLGGDNIIRSGMSHSVIALNGSRRPIKRRLRMQGALFFLSDRLCHTTSISSSVHCRITYAVKAAQFWHRGRRPRRKKRVQYGTSGEQRPSCPRSVV
jgi:hypothetical protein